MRFDFHKTGFNLKGHVHTLLYHITVADDTAQLTYAIRYLYIDTPMVRLTGVTAR